MMVLISFLLQQSGEGLIISSIITWSQFGSVEETPISISVKVTKSIIYVSHPKTLLSDKYLFIISNGKFASEVFTASHRFRELTTVYRFWVMTST